MPATAQIYGLTAPRWLLEEEDAETTASFRDLLRSTERVADSLEGLFDEISDRSPAEWEYGELTDEAVAVRDGIFDIRAVVGKTAKAYEALRKSERLG